MDEAFERAVRLVEAFVFASADPVAVSALERLVPMPHSAYGVLLALQKRCQGRGVHLVEVGGGWQFRTAVDLAGELATVMEKPRRLPRVAMEVLAIVAQYQPVTRAEIEDIRGVSLGQATVDILLEAGLIEPKGFREVPGRPTVWTTTPAFLVHFGLRSLRDVPGGGELSMYPATVGPTGDAVPAVPLREDARVTGRAEGGER